MTNSSCPCGAPDYLQCCGRFIENNQNPSTPEELMRSRYSAFARGAINYLRATMTGPAAKGFNMVDTLMWLQDVQWLALKVLDTRLKTPLVGFVSFEAHYLYKGIPQAICEKSEFHKIENKWFYVDGKKRNLTSKLE